ncbi:MAG: hypothetical protein LBT23_12465, partial [Synergistaceae bacterium]|nr:hypothetical protein [Synergistaceae bacterium]
LLRYLRKGEDMESFAKMMLATDRAKRARLKAYLNVFFTANCFKNYGGCNARISRNDRTFFEEGGCQCC